MAQQPMLAPGNRPRANKPLKSKPNTHFHVAFVGPAGPKNTGFGPTLIWAQAQFRTHLARSSMKQQGTVTRRAFYALSEALCPCERLQPKQDLYSRVVLGPKWLKTLRTGTVSDPPDEIFDEVTQMKF